MGGLYKDGPPQGPATAKVLGVPKVRPVWNFSEFSELRRFLKRWRSENPAEYMALQTARRRAAQIRKQQLIEFAFFSRAVALWRDRGYTRSDAINLARREYLLKVRDGDNFSGEAQ